MDKRKKPGTAEWNPSGIKPWRPGQHCIHKWMPAWHEALKAAVEQCSRCNDVQPLRDLDNLTNP